MVGAHEDGREKFFYARLEGLREVSDWTEQYKIFWTKKLDALAEFLEQKQSTPKKRTSKNVKRNKK